MEEPLLHEHPGPEDFKDDRDVGAGDAHRAANPRLGGLERPRDVIDVRIEALQVLQDLNPVWEGRGHGHILPGM